MTVCTPVGGCRRFGGLSLPASSRSSPPRLFISRFFIHDEILVIVVRKCCIICEKLPLGDTYHERKPYHFHDFAVALAQSE
jgi:hypothetical protein